MAKQALSLSNIVAVVMKIRREWPMEDQQALFEEWGSALDDAIEICDLEDPRPREDGDEEDGFDEVEHVEDASGFGPLPEDE